MIFGGKNIKQFGRCKVLKWDNSLYTDFDNKFITYRGQVLAQNQAPTVRTIKASVLAICTNTMQLTSCLDSIAEWLYETGESHLISSRDTAHYYKAMCTSITVPSYEGSTATFTVTFTCTDDRLFNVNDDEPIMTNTTALNNFTFDGKHCLNDMNCVFVLDKIDAVPEISVQKYTVSGMSGTVRYGNGECPVVCEKEMSGNLYFVKNKTDMSLMTDTQIANCMHKVSQWLVNAGRSNLILDNDTSIIYQAEVQDEMELSVKDWYNGSIKLKMTLQPVSKSEGTVQWSNDSVSIPNDDMVEIKASSTEDKDVGYKTPIIITLTVKSGSLTSLSVGTRNLNNEIKYLNLLQSRGFSLSQGQQIQIDSQSSCVSFLDPSTEKYVDKTQWVGDGRFPHFYPGKELDLCLKGTAATVDVAVTYDRRWV